MYLYVEHSKHKERHKLALPARIIDVLMGFLVVYVLCPSHSLGQTKKTTPPRPNRFEPKPAAGKVYVKVKYSFGLNFILLCL